MPATDHPSAAELQAFAIGALPESEARVVESHLTDCPSCLAAAAAAPDDTLVALLRSSETSQAGPATPATVFAETVGLSQPDGPADATRPAALLDHPKYRLIRPLGRGGMGHVWLAEHTLMNRLVALKVVRPEYLDRPEAVERFRREVRAAARLNHPNIVAAHDAEQAGGTHFLVMEYIDGETLAERIDAGPVAIDEVCRWTIDAARGLEHARASGLIHRDVKPHNLIRERTTGRVKVLDFGLAGVTAGEASGLTGGNVVIGTPDYIAPEQAEDPRTADTRSDVYSLGCALYHLLAGRPPFPGDTVMKKIDAHRTGEPEPLTAVRQDMTPALAELVARMLAKDPSHRPQTPGEVAVALEAILAGRGSGPPVPGRRRWGGGGRWRRRGRRVAVGALVLLGALGAVVYKLTDTADISVSNEAADQVKWVIKKDGYVVSEPSRALLTSLILPAGGEYTVELDRPDEFAAFPKSFAVRRGENLTIRVVRVARAPQPAAVGPAAPTDAGWTDLIPLIDPLASVEAGRVSRHDGPRPALTVSSHREPRGHVRVPYRPSGSYEVRATINRVRGEDAFVLVLPVPGGPGADPHVALYVDWAFQAGHPDPAWSGFQSIDNDWKGGSMIRGFGGRLAPDRAYALHVRVAVEDHRVALRAELDGKVLADWTGRPSELRGGGWWTLKDNRQLAIGVLAGEFRVERLEARLTPGTGSPPTATLHGKPDAPWTELLSVVDASRDREAGTVTKYFEGPNAVSLIGPGTGRLSRVAVPVRPDGDYEIRTRITRLTGTDSFNLMLPIPGTAGRNQAGVRVDTTPDRDAVAGLDWLGGFAMPLEKTLESRLKPGQPYDVVARVTTDQEFVRVRVAVSGKVVLEWDGPIDEVRKGTTAFTADPRCVGFGATASEFRVDGFQFRVLNGTAAIGRPTSVTNESDVLRASGVGTAPAAPEPGPVTRFGRYKGSISHLFFSPDGTDIYVGDDEAARWNVPTRQSVWATPTARGTSQAALALSGDGKVLIAWGPDGYAHVLNPSDGKETRKFPIPPEGVLDAVLNRDGTRAVTSSGDDVLKQVRPRVRVWDVTAGKDSFELTGPTDNTFGLALSPDGLRVAAASHDNAVRVWDAMNGKEMGVFRGHTGAPIAVAFSPDGKYLASGGEDPVIRVWGLEEKRTVSALPGHTGWVTGLSFTPDGTRLVSTSGFDGKGDGVRVWDWRTGDLLNHLTEGRGQLSAVAVTADGRYVVTGDAGGQVRVWRIPGPPAPKPEAVGPVRRFGRFTGDVMAIAWDKDGKHLYALDSGVVKWDPAAEKVLWANELKQKGSYHLAVPRDGRHVLAGCEDGTVRVLSADSGKQVRRFTRHREPILCVAASPDGKRAVSASGDDEKDLSHSIRVWEIDTGRELFELKGHTDLVWGAAYSPDGSRIATAGGDGTVRVWDAADGKEMAVLTGHKGQVSAVAFSPDGTRLVSGGQDLTVRVWDVEKKRPALPPLEGHDAWVTDVAFTPDGTRILSVGDDWEREERDGLRVWDAATGKPLYEGPKPGIPAVALAAAPNGQYAVTGGAGGSIRVWKVPHPPRK